MLRIIQYITLPLNSISMMRGDSEQIIELLLHRDSEVIGFNAKTEQVIICFDPNKPLDELHCFCLAAIGHPIHLFVDDHWCGSIDVGGRLVGVFHRPAQTRVIYLEKP
jgi:hypothetical protein